MALAFSKYEGLGNDFIVIEVSDTAEISAQRVVALCDRHYGIGGDGVLMVTPGGGPELRAKMTVVNADGSRPEMCGNGLRCVALHLALVDQRREADYLIDTDGGSKRCRVVRSDGSAQVTAGMGQAQLLGEYRHRYADGEITFLRVSTGNPHAVAFDTGCNGDDVDHLGPRVSAAFEHGLNVEFASSGSDGFDVIVWERGVGRTLACGTGAVATAVAATATGRARFGEPVEVRLPGGPLHVTVDEGTRETTLRGPARLVFKGELG